MIKNKSWECIGPKRAWCCFFLLHSFSVTQNIWQNPSGTKIIELVCKVNKTIGSPIWHAAVAKSSASSLQLGSLSCWESRRQLLTQQEKHLSPLPPHIWGESAPTLSAPWTGPGAGRQHRAPRLGGKRKGTPKSSSQARASNRLVRKKGNRRWGGPSCWILGPHRGYRSRRKLTGARNLWRHVRKTAFH